MGDYYVLNAHGDPERVDDVLTWAAWFERADRVVAVDRFDHAFPPSEDLIYRALKYTTEHQVTTMDWSIVVSTVFLGLDHSFGRGPAVLWESMIFGGPRSGDCLRYMSRVAALAGHAQLCAVGRQDIAEWAAAERAARGGDG